jgi:hypothetical protein
MSPTSSHNGSSRTFRASQGLGGKTGNAARRSYPRGGALASMIYRYPTVSPLLSLLPL